jgi:hypothetical protein
MSVKQVAATALLALASCAALAAGSDIGSAASGNYRSVSAAAWLAPAGGTYADTYSFLFPITASPVSPAPATFGRGSLRSGDSLGVALYTGSNVYMTQDAGVRATERSAAIDSSRDGIGADYFHMLGSVATMREPENIATLLAGLGAVGFIAARRRIGG